MVAPRGWFCPSVAHASTYLAMQSSPQFSVQPWMWTYCELSGLTPSLK